MTSLNLIHEKVCEYYSVDYMYPFKNNRSNIHVKHIFYYVARHLNGDVMSYREIGNYLSDIRKVDDHSTVISAYNKISGQMEVYPSIKKEVENILNLLPKYV